VNHTAHFTSCVGFLVCSSMPCRTHQFYSPSKEEERQPTLCTKESPAEHSVIIVHATSKTQESTVAFSPRRIIMVGSGQSSLPKAQAPACPTLGKKGMTMTSSIRRLYCASPHMLRLHNHTPPHDPIHQCLRTTCPPPPPSQPP
jgi:hypothetical protein